MKKRKNVLRKDFYMEIARTFNRFISIFLIVAMGVAFFSGIRASEPDLRYTADDYFDDSQLMDIRIQSTLGLTDDDVAAIKEVDGVADAVGSYDIDVVCWSEDNQKVFKVMADMEEKNQIDVLEGRMPEKAGECLIDAGTLENYNFEIGDTITFESGDDSDILDTLTTNTFTVVGIGSSPEYITFTRGSTTIGDGELDSFAIVTPDSFSSEVYTKVDVWVEGAADEVCYTDGYDEKVAEVLSRLEDTVADARCEARYNEVYGEAMGEIQDAQDELDDARSQAEEELADALATLESSEAELEEGENTVAQEQKTLEDGWAELLDGEAQLASGKNELDAQASSLASAWQQYYDGLEQYNAQAAQTNFAAARQAIADGRAQIDSQEALLNQQISDIYAQAETAATQTATQQVEEGFAQQTSEIDAQESALNELKDGLAKIKSQYDQTSEALSQVNEQIEALNAAGQTVPEELSAQQASLGAAQSQLKPQLDALQEQYDSQYDSGMAQIAAARTALEEAKAGALDSAVAQAVEAARKQVDEQLAQNEEIISARQAINDARTQLDSQEQQLNAGEQALADAKAQLDASYSQLVSAQAQIDSAYSQLADNEALLADSRAQLEDGQSQLEDALNQLEEGRQELEDGWQEYEEAKADAKAELDDGQKEIDDARAEVEEIEYPQWYVTDRSSLSGNAEFGENADRIKAIGEIFPVLFFLVAALISLTTMTRMVEEERIQIGTLKALGYNKWSIAKKYIYYALLATITGSIVGVLFGEKVFPYIIVNAYKIVYPYIPNTTIPYDLYYGLMASLAAIICITAATVLACYKELIATPAALMRPVPPKQGRRILLERVSPLWRRLSFTQKSTLRNLFRYKKRFFMTIFGIGGCMALMVVGFGLKDSIKGIVELQYSKIQPYSGMVILDEEASQDEKDLLYNTLDETSGVNGYKDVYMLNMDVSSADDTVEAYVVVPKDQENLDQFLYFDDRVTGEEYELGDSGVIISEKTASLLGVGAGDTITIQSDNFTSDEVTISAVCENYVGNYIYMTPTLYEQTFGEAPPFNTVLIRIDGDSEKVQDQIGQILLGEEAVVSVSYMDSIKASLNDMLSSLDIIIVVLIISAGMLAFIVLYNLNNININERRRELASIKVLGFYDLEVAAYVYRENVYLTLIGMIFGCILGKILHQFIIVTVEIDSCMFSRVIYWPSYVYSMLLTLVFSILVNVAMFYKLRKIDMVESLKSVE